MEENIKRIQNKNRLQRFKSINPEDAYPEGQLIKITNSNLLELNVTNLSSKDAAAQILENIAKL